MTRTRSQAGSVTLWLAVMVVALFAAAGLVYDGGQALARDGRWPTPTGRPALANNSLDRAQLAEGAIPSPDPTAAVAAARAFLAQAGVDPDAATVTIAGGTSAVAVRITEPTHILGVVGVGSLTVTGHGVARPVYGLGPGEP